MALRAPWGGRPRTGGRRSRGLRRSPGRRWRRWGWRRRPGLRGGSRPKGRKPEVRCLRKVRSVASKSSRMPHRQGGWRREEAVECPIDRGAEAEGKQSRAHRRRVGDLGVGTWLPDSGRGRRGRGAGECPLSPRLRATSEGQSSALTRSGGCLRSSRVPLRLEERVALVLVRHPTRNVLEALLVVCQASCSKRRRPRLRPGGGWSASVMRGAERLSRCFS